MSDNEIAAQRDDTFKPPVNPLLLFEGDANTDLLVTHPLNTTASNRGFLQPKYNRLRTVTFEVFGSSWPNDVDDGIGILDTLPAGFVRDPYFGLGLNWYLRYLIEAIEELDGVTDLRIRRGRRSGEPKISGRSYSITAKMFDDARKAINRVHNKALVIAASEKRVYAHNTLLTALDPIAHPEQSRAYRKDAIIETIGKSIGRSVALSAADQEAVIMVTRAAAGPLSRAKPGALLELNREIEVVTLEALIERIDAMLAKRLKEAAWQAFFIDNPFVLRLAFGLPIMIVGDQISVGGRRFSGVGDKISDFVAKAAASGNLALIEIKTPETSLLETTPYRGSLHAPGRELSGAVNQVLDQRYQLQKSIQSLKENSGIWDIETYAVQGLVIAGRTPNTKDKLKSLELFRNGLKSVMVVTFDEMLTKLKYLLDFLREPSASTAPAPVAVAPPKPAPIVAV